MELMNYNRQIKKKSGIGIFNFILFTVVGTIMVFYMIKNEPKPEVLGESMYIPVGSVNVYDETNETDIDIKDPEYLGKIKYKVKSSVERTTKGNFKLNLSLPILSIDGEEMGDINREILNKFKLRYEAVKEQADALENKFTYKVTYNAYDSMLNGKRVVSFTFYERIIDDMAGEDTTYKLYGVTIDLATKKILTQDDVAPEILGNQYKQTIKSSVKEQLITKKFFTLDNYSYVITGLEEFYVKEGKLHIMFNPGEMGANKDYIDLTI